jgi:hypothetical protein
MPSPFPGMDPYLEDPALWPDVHHEIISEARAYLNRRVGPRYHVRLEERVYISDEDDPGRPVLIPDLKIGERPDAGRAIPPESAALAVVEPIVITTLIDDEIREARLEVIDREDRQVVTVIEVVSPSNKATGSRGRASYMQKRAEVMTSPSHWVEIDLLRRGQPVLPRGMLGRGDYFAHVSRVEQRPKGQVWPILLPQRLPVVAIPLKTGDADAPLDLQAVFDSAYDRAAYDRTVDYRKEPSVPLSPAYAAWADRVLRERKVR